ncbi:MAG: hypothetical protein Q7S61_02885, partial [bacterium]|nr:hypothetical protein [bacterium]
IVSVIALLTIGIVTLSGIIVSKIVNNNKETTRSSAQSTCTYFATMELHYENENGPFVKGEHISEDFIIKNDKNGAELRKGTIEKDLDKEGVYKVEQSVIDKALESCKTDKCLADVTIKLPDSLEIVKSYCSPNNKPNDGNPSNCGEKSNILRQFKITCGANYSYGWIVKKKENLSACDKLTSANTENCTDTCSKCILSTQPTVLRQYCKDWGITQAQSCDGQQKIVANWKERNQSDYTSAVNASCSKECSGQAAPSPKVTTVQPTTANPTAVPPPPPQSTPKPSSPPSSAPGRGQMRIKEKDASGQDILGANLRNKDTCQTTDSVLPVGTVVTSVEGPQIQTACANVSGSDKGNRDFVKVIQIPANTDASLVGKEGLVWSDFLETVGTTQPIPTPTTATAYCQYTHGAECETDCVFGQQGVCSKIRDECYMCTYPSRTQSTPTPAINKVFTSESDCKAQCQGLSVICQAEREVGWVCRQTVVATPIPPNFTPTPLPSDTPISISPTPTPFVCPSYTVTGKVRIRFLSRSVPFTTATYKLISPLVIKTDAIGSTDSQGGDYIDRNYGYSNLLPPLQDTYNLQGYLLDNFGQIVSNIGTYTFYKSTLNQTTCFANTGDSPFFELQPKKNPDTKITLHLTCAAGAIHCGAGEKLTGVIITVPNEWGNIKQKIDTEMNVADWGVTVHLPHGDYKKGEIVVAGKMSGFDYYAQNEPFTASPGEEVNTPITLSLMLGSPPTTVTVEKEFKVSLNGVDFNNDKVISSEDYLILARRIAGEHTPEDILKLSYLINQMGKRVE